MAYVTVPKDLSKIKTKVFFGLTKRQLICFTPAVLLGVPLFFLLKESAGNSTATLCMMMVMLPFFLLAMYEKNGQPLEVILKQMIKLHQFAIMCAPTNSQYAAVEGLRSCEDEVAEMRKSYNQRRRFLMHEFAWMGLECFEPFGAFYVFPSIREFGMSSEEFAERLLMEEKVAVVPGTAFGACGEGFLRISYAYSLEDLKVALGRLGHFIERLRNER